MSYPVKCVENIKVKAPDRQIQLGKIHGKF